jgi:hypothetical protein
LVVALALAVHPRGRYLAAQSALAVRQAARVALRRPTPRSELDERWGIVRQEGIAEATRALADSYAQAPAAYQHLMRYAGIDPDHGLLRWGNFDRTLLLPSTVFEADDTGRSYRLLPNRRSIWLRNVTFSGVLTFFLVPDRQELESAIRGTPAIVVEESRQSTNSWGLRGPEPDPDAPLRGIVLGDSFMQGMFIGDQETPAEQLRRDLEARRNSRVSILNTGHLGYSPEQYYHSLLAFVDRFRPHFVVVSFFANDFGDASEVIAGRGNWEEGHYWLNAIADQCRSLRCPCLFVPAPLSSQMFGRRRSGYYPGLISNMLGTSALDFLNPTDSFINAHLETVIEGNRKDARPGGCLLFNEAIADGHFSAQGAQVWASAVGRRVELILERERATSLATAN